MKKNDYTTQIIDLIKRAENSPLGIGRGNLDVEGADYYVRVGKKFINNEYIFCFQIARISTPEPLQATGIFTRFLNNLRALTSIPIYVELVHNNILALALEKRGFQSLKKDFSGAEDFFLK